MALGTPKTSKGSRGGAAATIRSNQQRSRVARPGSARRGRTASNDIDAANRVGGAPGMGISYPGGASRPV